MSVTDGIIYLRSLNAQTLHTASIYRLREIADEMERQARAIGELKAKARELQTEVEDIMRKLNRGPL